MLRPAVLPKASTGRAAKMCRDISLVLAGCLAFLVPFSASRNIDLQGILLLVSGVFAWVSLLIGSRQIFASLGRLTQVLLGIFSISCLISFLVNPHFGYGFFGAPYIRLGFGGFAACIGIGLLARTVPRRQLLTGLYMLIVSLSLISLPYNWLHIHSLLRIGGVFAQADVFACFLGCGFLLGLEMLSLYPKWRNTVLGTQFILVLLLLLTQTRAVLLLVAVLGLLWIFRNQSGKAFKRMGICAITVLLLLVAFNYARPNRFTDTGYASQSLRYRLTLQGYTLQASAQKPLWGYGPGNLADALDCSHLTAKTLQTTCGEGYFFNSSHNIFLDRALAIGWPGGLAFLGLVVLAIYRGFRGKKEYRIFGYVLLLIGCYYLTNVTSLTLELLLWILLLQYPLSRA